MTMPRILLLKRWRRDLATNDSKTSGLMSKIIMSKLHSFFNDSTFSASSLQDERTKRPHSLIWFAINDFRGESICESWERPDFLVLRNNTIQLKKEHKYYYQVTGLMGVCGIPNCYVLVWTLRGYTLNSLNMTLDFGQMSYWNLSCFLSHIWPKLCLDYMSSTLWWPNVIIVKYVRFCEERIKNRKKQKNISDKNRKKDIKLY